MATTDIDSDYRTSGVKVPMAKQMVNGIKMRELIARMLCLFGEALSKNSLNNHPQLKELFDANKSRFMGLVLGAISDFCFNMEYARRITDNRWSYCSKSGDSRVYYPYLGVCPHCVLKGERPIAAVLGASGEMVDEERESRARYFGNKIESHHVGRIGERVLVYLLDLITKSNSPDSTTLIVFDDQHDVDAAFFFEGIGVIAQIKASPLILLPVVSYLDTPLTDGVSKDTGLPVPRRDHTFTGFSTPDHELKLYFSRDNSSISIGKRGGDDWPYEPLIAELSEDDVLRIISNWIAIYLAFEVPKRQRVGDEIKLAWLTSGWGAPIDDNKTKAGLARSDNIMKGTYASLKYGAYYVQECQRKTLRTALVANIDPAHQYADYLEKLEDIRWGHNKDFTPTKSDSGDAFTIAANKLAYLFDSVFTFNRQIMNDPKLKDAWSLEKLCSSLTSKDGIKRIKDWARIK